MRRALTATGIVFALVGFAALWTTVANPAVVGKPDAVIYVTGNVVGYLEECGCPQKPLGGIDRRASFLLDQARGLGTIPHMVVDVGDFSDVPGPAGAIKTRGLLEAMNEMNYIASGLGRQELAMGAEQLTAFDEVARFPFVSANVVRKSNGKPWGQARVVQQLGTYKVGITGVTKYDPTQRVRLPDGDTLIVVDPEPALRAEVSALRAEGVDYVLVLALVPMEESRRLAQNVAGIDLILAAFGQRAIHNPYEVGDTSILYVGDQGKYVGQVYMYEGENGFSLDTQLIGLSAAIASDERMAMLAIETMAEANQIDLSQYGPMGAEASEKLATFLGVGSCTGCHTDIVKSWSESGHAHAYETLERRTEGVQPSCVPCHVTGYGHESGFASKIDTPHLIGVGCESCHGPASAHVQDPYAPYGASTLKTCTSCHDAKQDPDFDYYRSLPLVNHSSN